MTTDEAKEYLINHAEFSEEDFQRASLEDVACGLAEEGEWVHEFVSSYPISEAEMKTAIELAKEHKFINDKDQVKAYEDFMIDRIYKNKI